MTSKKIKFCIWIVYFILSISSQNVSYADDTVQDVPEISEKLGTKIDMNLMFTDDSGNTKTIKDMLEGLQAKGSKDKETVLIITLNYFRCTTMCTYQFMNLSEALAKMNLPVGHGYTIASISFDPTDDTYKAKTTRELWLKKLAAESKGLDPAVKPRNDIPWHFYTTADQKTIRKLADSLNFYFEKDDEGNYSHTAGLFFIDPNGILKRYLYGIVYEPRDIKYALIDTSNGKIGNLFDKIFMKLSKYNASRGKYQFYGS